MRLEDIMSGKSATSGKHSGQDTLQANMSALLQLNDANRSKITQKYEKYRDWSKNDHPEGESYGVGYNARDMGQEIAALLKKQKDDAKAAPPPQEQAPADPAAPPPKPTAPHPFLNPVGVPTNLMQGVPLSPAQLGTPAATMPGYGYDPSLFSGSMTPEQATQAGLYGQQAAMDPGQNPMASNVDFKRRFGIFGR